MNCFFITFKENVFKKAEKNITTYFLWVAINFLNKEKRITITHFFRKFENKKKKALRTPTLHGLRPAVGREGQEPPDHPHNPPKHGVLQVVGEVGEDVVAVAVAQAVETPT